jgi:uncharacterized protein
VPDLLASLGKNVNTASTSALQPGACMADYYATKALVFSFSEAIAAARADTGVTVAALRRGRQPRAFRIGPICPHRDW